MNVWHGYVTAKDLAEGVNLHLFELHSLDDDSIPPPHIAANDGILVHNDSGTELRCNIVEVGAGYAIIQRGVEQYLMTTRGDWKSSRQIWTVVAKRSGRTPSDDPAQSR